MLVVRLFFSDAMFRKIAIGLIESYVRFWSMKFIKLLSKAYFKLSESISWHDEKIKEERRQKCKELYEFQRVAESFTKIKLLTDKFCVNVLILFNSKSDASDKKLGELVSKIFEARKGILHETMLLKWLGVDAGDLDKTMRDEIIKNLEEAKLWSDVYVSLSKIYEGRIEIAHSIKKEYM